MKTLFIAASIVGAASAGLILYLQERTAQKRYSSKVLDAASNADNATNGSIARAERPGQHAMG